MRTELRVPLLAILLGVLVTVIDAFLDFFIFHEGTFLEILILAVPPHVVFIRSVMVASFVIFGVFVSKAMGQRERAAERANYLYSILTAIRNVNQLITTETNLDKLLQKTCEALVETRGYQHSWIVLLDAENHVTGSASAGLGVEFQQMLEMMNSGGRIECLTRTIEQSGVLVFDDPLLQHNVCPLNMTYPEGVALSTKLESYDQIYGVLGAAVPEGMTLDEELSLFKDVANDIAFALYRFDIEEAGSRAHLELLESEKKYRELYNDVRVGLVTTNFVDGKILECNNLFVQMFGFESREQALSDGIGVNLFVDPSDRTSFVSELKEKGFYDGELALKDLMENVIQCEVYSRFNHQNDRIESVLVDITERRRAEEKLQRSEEKHRTLVESMADLVFVYDRLDRYREFYGAPDHLLYVPPARFLGKHVKDVLPHDIAELFIEHSGIVRATGKPETFDYSLKMENQLFWFSANLSLHEDGEGIVAVVRDITDRKKAESAVRAAGDTAMLYLDLMGHDIRNQLQAIVMATEVLKHQDFEPEMQQVLDLIVESVSNSQNLIKKISSTRGLLFVPLSDTSLWDVLEECSSTVRETFDDVQVQAKCNARQSIIRADRYLEVLLMNLLENSVLHNNKKTRQLWIVLNEVDNGYEISIADNGPGIPDEKKETLFDPERRFGGVGIHQAIQIAHKYGGKLSVHDRIYGKPEQGARFRLWLPIPK
ncbi:MAG: ATP-binding protein [Candidatus Thorarchaeota archaeon]